MYSGKNALTDLPAILVVADEADAAAAGERIVAASVAAIVVRSDWRGASATAAGMPRLAGVYADARGGGDDVLQHGLPSLARATDLRLVVEIDREQIDGAASALLTTDAILLCEAEPVERAAAIGLAAAATGLVVRDTTRDAERYHRINAEVARFAETLARLSEQDSGEQATPVVADRMIGYGAPPAAAEDADPGEIRRAIRARRMRDDAFERPGLFEDPAWDMLLDLFAAELERRQVSVSSLCIAAAVAPTTALRWIAKLVEAGLLERRADEFDRRRAFISLTARASTAMRNYLTALRRAGLAIA